MFTKHFWYEVLERAVKTAAQFIVAYLTAVGSFQKVSFSVVTLGLAALFGFTLSVFTSLASFPLGDTDTPLAIKEVPVDEDA